MHRELFSVHEHPTALYSDVLADILIIQLYALLLMPC